MGYWKVFFGYFFAKEEGKKSMLYAKDLLRDKEHIFIHKHYFKIHALHFFTLLMINPILVYALYIFPAIRLHKLVTQKNLLPRDIKWMPFL